MIQRPMSISRAMRSMTGSGIGSSPSYHFDRPSVVRIAARQSVFRTCGTPSIVRSSMSRRSVSMTCGRSSFFQTRSQHGM
jgi:hypothetical protein